MAMLGSIAGVKQNIVICRLTIGVQGFGKVGLFDIALADAALSQVLHCLDLESGGIISRQAEGMQ